MALFHPSHGPARLVAGLRRAVPLGVADAAHPQPRHAEGPEEGRAAREGHAPGHGGLRRRRHTGIAVCRDRRWHSCLQSLTPAHATQATLSRALTHGGGPPRAQRQALAPLGAAGTHSRRRAVRARTVLLRPLPRALGPPRTHSHASPLPVPSRAFAPGPPHVLATHDTCVAAMGLWRWRAALEARPGLSCSPATLPRVSSPPPSLHARRGLRCVHLACRSRARPLDAADRGAPRQRHAHRHRHALPARPEPPRPRRPLGPSCATQRLRWAGGPVPASHLLLECLELSLGTEPDQGRGGAPRKRVGASPPSSQAHAAGSSHTMAATRWAAHAPVTPRGTPPGRTRASHLPASPPQHPRCPGRPPRPTQRRRARPCTTVGVRGPRVAGGQRGAHRWRTQPVGYGTGRGSH